MENREIYCFLSSLSGRALEEVEQADEGHRLKERLALGMTSETGAREMSFSLGRGCGSCSYVQQ